MDWRGNYSIYSSTCRHQRLVRDIFAATSRSFRLEFFSGYRLKPDRAGSLCVFLMHRTVHQFVETRFAHRTQYNSSKIREQSHSILYLHVENIRLNPGSFVKYILQTAKTHTSSATLVL